MVIVNFAVGPFLRGHCASSLLTYRLPFARPLCASTAMSHLLSTSPLAFPFFFRGRCLFSRPLSCCDLSCRLNPCQLLCHHPPRHTSTCQRLPWRDCRYMVEFRCVPSLLPPPLLSYCLPLARLFCYCHHPPSDLCCCHCWPSGIASPFLLSSLSPRRPPLPRCHLSHALPGPFLSLPPPAVCIPFEGRLAFINWC